MDQYKYRKTVPIQGIDMNTENSTDVGDQYEYRKTIQLKNNISKSFKLFTTIKKKIIVKLSSGQASEHPSRAK